MSLAYKCDRCGTFYPDKQVSLLTLHELAFSQTDTILDLCPSCQQELEQWRSRTEEAENLEASEERLLIYPFMSDESCYVERPAHFLRYVVSVDYGTVNPCSAGLWGLHKNSWYRIDEYYFDSRKEGYQRTDVEHYDAICEMIGNRAVDLFIIDPSAASFIEVVRRNSEVPVVTATISATNTDIKLVTKALKEGAIKICNDCNNAKREFKEYAWRICNNRCKGPLRINDHAMDDIRYFAATILTFRSENDKMIME